MQIRERPAPPQQVTNCWPLLQKNRCRFPAEILGSGTTSVTVFQSLRSGTHIPPDIAPVPIAFATRGATEQSQLRLPHPAKVNEAISNQLAPQKDDEQLPRPRSFCTPFHSIEKFSNLRQFRARRLLRRQCLHDKLRRGACKDAFK